ncbi:MAG: AAA family ATPase [Dehalococcoidia bacterium]
MLRFHRLVSIDRFRYFKAWSDNEDDARHSFGKRTAIYGPNGSGKSTLAELFHRIELAQIGTADPGEELLGVTFELTDGAKKFTRRGDQELPPVVVFGQRYVERNLRRAFEDPDAVGEPLYVMGSEQVERDQEIEQRVLQIAAKRDELARRTTETKAATEVVNAHTAAIQTALTASLGKHDTNTYNKTYFNKTRVARLIEDHSSSQPLTEAELHDRQRELEADFDDKVTLPTLPGLDELSERLSALASYEVTARAIERLADSHELATWAKGGLALHQAGERCGFCDGEVREERLQELRFHFDASYDEFEGRLKNAKTAVQLVEQALTAVEQGLRDLVEGTSATAQWATEHRAGIDRLLGEVHSWVQAANETIDFRGPRPFDVTSWEPPPQPDWSPWRQLAAQAEQENAELKAKREDLEATKKTAEQAILGHIAAKHGEEYNPAKQALEKAGKDKASVEGELAELERSLAELRAQQQDQRDGNPLATQLTATLQRYLGFRKLEVEFVPGPDRAGFRIKRDDVPAQNLSEGERGAIALLHFLTMLHSDRFNPNSEGSAGKKLDEHVVVIDDPVSSFDNDAIVGAFTYLWESFKGKNGLRCSQLVVLTHNFQFLQLWRREFDRRFTPKDRRDAKDEKCEPHELLGRRCAVLELRPTLTGGDDPQRYSRLRDLTSGRPGTSEYHLLFQHVCEAVQRDEEGLALLAGNAGRRLLESFVLWKRPDETSMPDAARKLAEPTSLPDFVLQRVVKTLHATSHREEVAVDQYPYVGDVLDELRTLLEFMREVDRDHYEGMCRATGMSPSPLISATPSS